MFHILFPCRLKLTVKPYIQLYSTTTFWSIPIMTVNRAHQRRRPLSHHTLNQGLCPLLMFHILYPCRLKLLSTLLNNNFLVNPHYDSKLSSPKKKAPEPPHIEPAAVSPTNVSHSLPLQVEAYSKAIHSTLLNNNFLVNPHYDSKHSSSKKKAPEPPYIEPRAVSPTNVSHSLPLQVEAPFNSSKQQLSGQSPL